MRIIQVPRCEPEASIQILEDTDHFMDIPLVVSLVYEF